MSLVPRVVLMCGFVAAAVACGDDSASGEAEGEAEGGTTGDAGPGTTGEPGCVPGELSCAGDVEQRCGADGVVVETACEAGCAETLGCVACVPDTAGCDGETLQRCRADGSRWDPVEVCDSVAGLSCDATQGRCVGACAEAAAPTGCEFFATTTSIATVTSFVPGAGVGVVNASDAAAQVTVTRGFADIAVATVDPGAAAIIELPPVDEFVAGTALVVAGAYRVRSTQPIAAYQFVPLEAANSGESAVLWPVQAWGHEHVVASLRSLSDSPTGDHSLYAVTASVDGTQVEVTGAPGELVFLGVPELGVLGSGTVTLDAGDVLAVHGLQGTDLTGTRIASSAPVEVLAGNTCATVPIDAPFCDATLDVLPPVRSMGTDHVFAPPPNWLSVGLDVQYAVRVVSMQPDTQLTYDPPQFAPAQLEQPGEAADLLTRDGLRITATAPVIATQMLVGSEAEFGAADPSMVVAVPVSAHGTDHFFVSPPPAYTVSVADVLAPVGAAVEFDGAPLDQWQLLGDTGYQRARVVLTPGGHRLRGSEPITANVYGLRNDLSAATSTGFAR